MSSDINRITEYFDIPRPVIDIKLIGSGHIHSTYLVKCTESAFILQNINNFVFKDITGLMENIVRVCNHMEVKIHENKLSWTPMKVIYSEKGESFIHHEDTYWRMLNFIPHTSIEENPSDPEIVFEAGMTYGKFIHYLSHIPGKPLNETIPRFHDLDYRHKNFLDAVKNGNPDRIKTAAAEIEEAIAGMNTAEELQKLIREKVLPQRVTHNDTKITNILFNEERKAVCVIDLDTVMPGVLHFDFGDSIRTFANSADEDERDTGRVRFKFPAYKNYTQGFMQGVSSIITEQEKETLVLAPYFITCEQAVRFLTDYLLDDQYYHVDYPDHNMVRTRVQLTLMRRMKENQGEMEKIILK